MVSARFLVLETTKEEYFLATLAVWVQTELEEGKYLRQGPMVPANSVKPNPISNSIILYLSKYPNTHNCLTIIYTHRIWDNWVYSGLRSTLHPSLIEILSVVCV